MKPGLIAYASFLITLDTGGSDANEIAAQIKELLGYDQIVVPKHTKSGFIDLDIKPYLDKTKVTPKDSEVEISSILPAGSTININPALLSDAIKKYLNLDLYADVRRINIFDSNFRIFE